MNVRALSCTLAIATAGCHGTVEGEICCSPSCCAMSPSTVECRADGACVTTLATTTWGPGPIAIDATDVYWAEYDGVHADGAGVMKVPIHGGEVTTLASAPETLPTLWTIAVDARNVYWSTYAPNRSVFACAITGCNKTPTLLAASPADPGVGPFDIASDGVDVYWTTFAGESVMKCAAAGCGGSPSTLATTAATTESIVLDDANAYWSVEPDGVQGGTVWRCAKDDCSGGPTLLVSGLASVQDVAVDATKLYWTEYDGGVLDGRVRTCPKTGCASPSNLAEGQIDYGGSPGPIVQDDENVYWTVRGSGPAVVRKCAKTGCGYPDSPTEVVSFPAGGGALAVDATGLYYATDHAIMKISPK